MKAHSSEGARIVSKFGRPREVVDHPPPSRALGREGLSRAPRRRGHPRPRNHRRLRGGVGRDDHRAAVPAPFVSRKPSMRYGNTAARSFRPSWSTRSSQPWPSARRTSGSRLRSARRRLGLTAAGRGPCRPRCRRQLARSAARCADRRARIAGVVRLGDRPERLTGTDAVPRLVAGAVWQRAFESAAETSTSKTVITIQVRGANICSHSMTPIGRHARTATKCGSPSRITAIVCVGARRLSVGFPRVPRSTRSRLQTSGMWLCP